jgi:hypothetical protein
MVGDHRFNYGRIRGEWGVALLPLFPVIVSGRVNLTTPDDRCRETMALVEIACV